MHHIENRQVGQNIQREGTYGGAVQLRSAADITRKRIHQSNLHPLKTDFGTTHLDLG